MRFKVYLHALQTQGRPSARATYHGAADVDSRVVWAYGHGHSALAFAEAGALTGCNCTGGTSMGLVTRPSLAPNSKVKAGGTIDGGQALDGLGQIVEWGRGPRDHDLPRKETVSLGRLFNIICIMRSN
jgi:hypothetical protein